MKREAGNFGYWCMSCGIAVISGIVLSFWIRFEVFPWMLLYLPGEVYDTLSWIIYGIVLGGVIGAIQSMAVPSSFNITLRRVAALSIGFSLLFLFEENILGRIDEFLGAVPGLWLISTGSGLVVGTSMDWIVWPNVCVSSFLHGGLAGLIIGCVSKVLRVEKDMGILAGMKHYFWSFSLGCVVGSLFFTVIVLGVKYFGLKDQSLYAFGLSSLVYWWLSWCLLCVPQWWQGRKDLLEEGIGVKA
jgi:hypothetical protein